MPFKIVFSGFLLLCLSFLPVFGQEESVSRSVDSLLISNGDKTPADTVPSMPRTSLEASIQRTQEASFKIGRVNQILRKELDTTDIALLIPQADRFIQTVESRLDNPESKINLRYINALLNWRETIGEKINNEDKNISSRIQELALVKQKLDSIRQDDNIRGQLRDTTLLPEYQQSLRTLRTNLELADSTLNAQRLSVARFQSRVANLNIRIKEIDERLHSEKRILERALFSKETNYIWEPREFFNTERLIDVFRDSLRFNLIILGGYINNHLGLTAFLIILALLMYRWASSNLRKIRSEKEFATIIMARIRYLPKHPFLTSLLFVLAIAPLLFTNPPVSFFIFILILTVSISGILLRLRIGKRGMRVWLLLYGLFVISSASNLYWEVAYQERWHLLLFNLAGVLLGLKLIRLQKMEKEYIPEYVHILAKIYISFCSISILANILGRFSLAKMIGITATLSLLHAISLIIFIIIIKEFIYLQIEVSRKNENEFTSVIDFYDIQKRINSLFSYLAIAIWAYYFFESLTILETLLEGIGEFLSKPRNILNATFTFAQIAVFILVVYISTFLANTVAYFANIKDQQNVNFRNKRLGSSILLIRLAVLTVGFLIAIAASGIPVDKIAIVLGALSVGIGFGLQTIVNNLVSGVILAFERPIQIGDVIQVGSIEGTVREIGIRASKIKNWDGAEVIIPNGDLLAQQLTNWTLSDKQRRVELIIGVSYSADMDLVTRLIQEQLDREEVLKTPPARVYMQAFADSSVNFRVLFWVNDIDIWVILRDQVMRSIWKAFKDNNVEIPFPQRDLHVKSFPGLIKESISKASDIEESEDEDKKINPDKS
ncbi:mechanosensitive ion channel family protein [Arthrospiribacter ruber]|uniref:Mechanosensitive ion channel protein MscS n=1 Tax=Arthrospiribacter ruber TaxID=2487934 RepID=A0A951MIS7_9BACT|nr:mechanosensitive ion channel domain-containing protein [Arthrospiribacter ruber]MBW3469971.1 mechanosensitive ion channel protein MscS [Arthrospiribacter ruber]